MIRLTSPRAILGCLAAVAVVAASATAKTTTANANRASDLQHDLEALVAAGAPGVILFVRDGERTTTLTAGMGDIARKTPMRADNHFKIASVTKPFTATVVLSYLSGRSCRSAILIPRAAHPVINSAPSSATDRRESFVIDISPVAPRFTGRAGS